MEKKEIRTRTLDVLDKIFGSRYDITDNSDFFFDFDCDSLDMVEVIVEVEKEFGITMPERAANNIHTVKDLIHQVSLTFNDAK